MLGFRERTNLRVSGINHILLKILSIIENKNKRNLFSFTLYQPLSQGEILKEIEILTRIQWSILRGTAS